MFKKVFLHSHKAILYASLAAGVALLLIALGTYLYFIRDISNKQRFMNKSSTGLTLLDDRGEVFFTFYDAVDKEAVSLDQIPKHTQNALIASEDREFYEHSGFSIKGIGRALFKNAKSGEIKEGGSTIPQELIKVALLSQERTYLRKYQELVLSLELNRRYTKEEILEMYLNSVYFGEGAFGIQNAAEIYFDKNSTELTLAESALLVGVLPAPSAMSPISNSPDKAFERQQYVLNAMVEEGMISQEEADAAASENLVFKRRDQDINVTAPHFALYVKEQLEKKYGEEKIIRSGYKVKTTLNSQWQKQAEQQLEQRILELQGYNASNGAVVSIDPSNGHIKVMAGSHNWFNENNGKINMAVTPRQPGSSFKPLVYAKAIEDRTITAATIINDVPKTYPDGYSPKNYDLRFRGPVTVRRALANSLNIPAVEVMNKVGVNKTVKSAKGYRITTLENPQSYGLSLVLGAAEVPLLQMTNAYAAFANNGKNFEPTAITEIQNKYGKRVFEHKEKEKRVLSEQAAFIITSILSDNNSRAEIFGNSLTINRPAAVKTGTTEEYRDSLTIGYTPNLVVGVWVGNNDNTPMGGVAGSMGAGPVWRNLMQSFMVDLPAAEFKIPSGIIKSKVCLIVDQPNDEKESNNDEEDEKSDEKEPKKKVLSYEEYFIRGTQPKNCTPDYLEQLQKQIEPEEKEENKKDDEEKKEDDDKKKRDEKDEKSDSEDNNNTPTEEEQPPVEEDTPESTESIPIEPPELL